MCASTIFTGTRKEMMEIIYFRLNLQDPSDSFYKLFHVPKAKHYFVLIFHK